MKPVFLFQRAALRTLALAISMLLAFTITPGSASAQYGGVSGLFVTTSPESPGFADFSGLGCEGGQEVILYFPGLQQRSFDPAGSQTVPGRVLAVTTAVSSPDALLNGTFSFPNIRLPTDVDAGVYEVRSRCGSLDLRVLIQIDANGLITTDPDSEAPISNSSPDDGPNGALPFTGRNANRVVSMGAGLIAAGLAFSALARRQRTS
jgi:hypothetical protein